MEAAFTVLLVSVSSFAKSSSARLHRDTPHSPPCAALDVVLSRALHPPRAPAAPTNARRMTECAKCNPIDISAVRAQKRNTRPPPTPVARQEVAPDGDLFAVVDSGDGSSRQPPPPGPNPKVGGKKKAKHGMGKASTMEVVVPEWKVLNTATQTTKRSGEEAGRHLKTFRSYFAEVHARSAARLRVDRSPVQVCVWRGERLPFDSAVHDAVGSVSSRKILKNVTVFLLLEVCC